MSLRRAASLTVAAWLTSLGALGWWLVELGRGPLGAPPLRHPGRWAAWAEATGPVPTTFALVRLLCLAAVVYLAFALLLGVAARLTGARILLRASEAISVAVVRRILNGAVGLGVTTGALAVGAAPLVPAAVRAVTVQADHRPELALAESGTPAALVLDPVTSSLMPPQGGPLTDAPDAGSAPVTMRAAAPRLAEPAVPPMMRPAETPDVASTAGPTMRPVADSAAVPSTPPSMRPVAQGAQSPTAPPTVGPQVGQARWPTTPPTMRPLERTPPGPAAPPILRTDGRVEPDLGSGGPVESLDAPGDRQPDSEPTPGADGTASSAALAGPSSVVLRPGDHLWAVAEQHLVGRFQRQPDDEQITTYWQRLLSLNVDQLADPANPDLVFAGQVIRLPPI